MDGPSRSAPPVVAVVVVHEPGPWLEECLDSLSAQTYPELSTLFLVAGTIGEVPERIKRRLPKAYIRGFASNAGFGAAANEVLRLVEGSGLFCFLHDDVALEPDAISRMVEELFRSNAGVVGPKLVEWDDPGVLQHVGLGIDRFGEIDPVIEPGELDQEQHDAVSDVFALPTACLIVRADLFRELGGFTTAFDFYGDGVDLCWRAHLHGARVVVVPSARARHRERLGERRPDLNHRLKAAQHRLFTVYTLTSARRLPLLTLQLIALSVISTLVGVFTRTARSGFATLTALAALPLRAPQILARRREVRSLRAVADHEVLDLQIRGSARLNAYRRHRAMRSMSQMRVIASRQRSRQQGSGSIAWFVLIALFAIGGFRLVRDGVPQVGQFAQLPAPRQMWSQYLGQWNPAGFGSSSAPPTALGVSGILGVLTWGHAGLLRTALILGPILLGCLGMWRAVSVFPTSRARMGGLAVYFANPLTAAAISVGRWSVLIGYGLMPWALLMLRRIAALIDVPGALAGDESIADVVGRVDRRVAVRAVAGLACIVGLALSVNPVFAVTVVLAALLWLVGTLITGGSRTVAWSAIGAVAACGAGFVLNLPWSTKLLSGDGWAHAIGQPDADRLPRGVLRTLGFGVGTTSATVLALAFYAPVVAAVAAGRGWRLTWAARSALLTAGFAVLAVLADQGIGPRLGDPGVLLVPVACGLAFGAANALTAFEFDVRGARFGWRQPVALLVNVCLVVGVVPFLATVFTGNWGARNGGLAAALNQLKNDDEGDFRVLYLGYPDTFPVPAHRYREDMGYAVVGDRTIAPIDLWRAPATGADAALVEAIDGMASARTARFGRLLAPFAVRYVVVPIEDGLRPGVNRTADDLPGGLLDALDRQLDLRPVNAPERVRVYENAVWRPIVSTLDQAAASASSLAGNEALSRALPGSGTPVLAGAVASRSASGNVEPGVLQLAVGDRSGWQLTVGGTRVPPRDAFGWSTTFDVATGGRASLRHDSGSRRYVVLLQLVLWAALAAVAFGLSMRWRYRTPVSLAGEPMLRMGPIADPLVGAAARPSAALAPSVGTPSGQPNGVDGEDLRTLFDGILEGGDES